MAAVSLRMDIAFNCDKCGQHIVIDAAGAGMTVPCPSCNENLIVPTKRKAVKKPAMTVNMAGPIQSLAKEIDAGLLEDDQKLDASLKARSRKAMEAVFGKAASDAFHRGELSGRDLLKSGKPLSLDEFEEIHKFMHRND